MITKELLDYISLELNEGKKRDDISALLLKEGWSKDVIDSAFKELNDSKFTFKNLRHKYLTKNNLIIISIGLFLIISSVALSIGGFSTNQEKQDNKRVNNSKEAVTPSLTIQPSLQNPTSAYSGQDSGDCGTEDYEVDLDNSVKKSFPKLSCFIAAAKACNSATLKLNSNVTAYGTNSNSIVDYRISKGNNGCILNINQGKISYTLPPGIPESMLEPITSSLKKMENTQGMCLFANNEDLASIFERLNNGDVSLQSQTAQSVEYLNGDCSGTYFTAANEVSESLQ